MEPKKDDAADIRFFQRLRSPDSLQQHLAAKLSHEDAIRQIFWCQVALFAALLASAIGVQHFLFEEIVTLGSSSGKYIALVCVLLAFVLSVCTGLYSVIVLEPDYKAVLYTAKQYAAWWFPHVRELKKENDEVKSGRLGIHERAILLSNMADAVYSVHLENRRRSRAAMCIQRLVVVVLCLTLISYITVQGIRLGSTSERGLQMAKETNPTADDDSTKLDPKFDEPDEIRLPETEICKGNELREDRGDMKSKEK